LTHVGAGAPAPATQTIPPRIRRLVWRRDHGRCQVPGCRAAKFLEVHRVRWRSDGGGHDPLNLAVACSIHHDLVHRGLLVVEGSAPDLVFRHADGRLYGQPRADDADVADAVAGLRRMGVPAPDARRAVAEAATSGAVAIEDLLRQALLVLGRTTYAAVARVSDPAAPRQTIGG
ncbi:MAG TPA: HNH endonuclease signature motif containing protein, partial [Kofleriaceae bacterium]|nr:HNH endonuclease signature motif containing protein [Kofleriaceae bacterium]